MSGQSITGLRLHTIANHYPLDLIILRMIVGKRKRNYDDIEHAIASLRRHLLRRKKDQNHPLLILLSNVLTAYDKHSYDLAICRKLPWFLKAEESLSERTVDESYRAVLSPKAIWEFMIEG